MEAKGTARYSLIIENGTTEGRVFPLEESLTIGRAADNDIQLIDSSVSRRHALIQFTDGKPVLEDLGSSNRTFVNGEKVNKLSLSNGDKLRLGRISLRLYQGDPFPTHESLVDTQVIEEVNGFTSPYKALPTSTGEIKPASSLYSAHTGPFEFQLRQFREIQSGFFPAQLPKIPDWEIVACLHPASEATGDFYDAFRLPGNYIALVIADVCDKGIGSALFMSLIRTLIRVFSGERRFPGLSVPAGTDLIAHQLEEQGFEDIDQLEALKAISLTNDYIAEEHGHTCMFATIFLGVLNPINGSLVYINGGHEPLVIVGPTGIVQDLPPTGPAVGLMPSVQYKIQHIQLYPGDILVGYTDGVTEALGPDGKLFTRKRLWSLLQEPAPSASLMLERVKASLFGYIGDARPTDDITLMVVQRSPVVTF
jgi:serine phosphatase RsbU (regulator of sigma subunit)